MAGKSAARRAWRVARGNIDPRCDYCGEITSERVKERDPRRATVEDIVPLSKGGSNTRSNWALACAECNQAKGDLHLEPTLPKLGGRFISKKGARTPVKMGQPFTVTKTYRPTQAERRARKCRKPDRPRIEEVERLARLARLPFTLYTPIPGVIDEAFR